MTKNKVMVIEALDFKNKAAQVSQNHRFGKDLKGLLFQPPSLMQVFVFYDHKVFPNFVII